MSPASQIRTFIYSELATSSKSLSKVIALFSKFDWLKWKKVVFRLYKSIWFFYLTIYVSQIYIFSSIYLSIYVSTCWMHEHLMFWPATVSIWNLPKEKSIISNSLFVLSLLYAKSISAWSNQGKVICCLFWTKRNSMAVTSIFLSISSSN